MYKLAVPQIAVFVNVNGIHIAVPIIPIGVL